MVLTLDLLITLTKAAGLVALRRMTVELKNIKGF